MFISLLIMTRYVGEEYGIMMWGWSILGLINILSDLGFDTATVKFISQGKDQNSCISTHLFIKSILIGTIVLITAVYLGVLILSGGIETENVIIVLVFLVYYTVGDLVWVLVRTFDGRLEATKSAIVQASDVSVRSAILIALALSGASAAMLSTGYIVGVIFSLIVAVFLFRGIKFKLVRPVFLKEYVSYAKPIAVGLLLVTAISFTDRVMVGFFWGTSELGFYSAAMGLAYAATAVGVALNYVLLPRFSELFSAGDRTSLESVLWKSEKYISMLFLPVVIFLMVFGDSIAAVFLGAGFVPAGMILSILAPYIYLAIMLGILTQVLYSTNNNRLYRNATFVYAVSTFTLLVLLVPENIGSIRLAGLGANGAALAITFGYLVFILLTHHFVVVSTKLHLHKGLIRQFLAGAIVFAVVFLIGREGPFGLPYLILLLLLCFALFSAILFLLKEMKKEDLVFILSSLNPRKISGDSDDKKS